MNVIPKVNCYTPKGDFVQIKDSIAVSFPDDCAFARDYFTSDMKKLGIEVTNGDFVRVEIDPKKDKDEYKLTIAVDGISIIGSFSGILYAAITLYEEIASAYSVGLKQIETCVIEDKPRYAWRGIMLDESRHFFGKDVVKRLLDQMTHRKLNVFHWHLTDDQGWRIEIKKYPLLTEIGSKRKDTQINGWRKYDFEGKPYEGFYTQEDIKEIIAYARDRQIMVVPEFDMPAHFMAAIAAYPHLSCRDVKVEVPYYCGGNYPRKAGIKDWNIIACAGKESTFQFIFDIIDEVATLFDSPYLHIGGDEAPKVEWKKCPHCQKRMKENNLASEEELQSYMNNRVNEYLHHKGMTLVGWNEILMSDKLDKSVIAQYWVHTRDKNVEKFLARGGKIIFSKHQGFYADMPYSNVTLKKTYSIEPAAYHIKAKNESGVMGVELPIWTEWIASEKHLQFMTQPRIAAFAENAWTMPKNKSFDSFTERLVPYKIRLDAQNVNYARDEISMAKGLLKRAKTTKIWNKADPEIELKLNEKLKLNKQ